LAFIVDQLALRSAAGVARVPKLSDHDWDLLQVRVDAIEKQRTTTAISNALATQFAPKAAAKIRPRPHRKHGSD